MGTNTNEGVRSMIYEVSVITIDKKVEKHKCRSIDEVLKLFNKLDDERVSSVSIKRLEGGEKKNGRKDSGKSKN